MQGLKIWLTASIVLCMSSAEAEEDPCAKSAEIAEQLMTARQNGVPLQEAVDSLKGIYAESTYEIIEKLVVTAYEAPRYTSTVNQKSAAKNFRDQAHFACLGPR